MKRSSFNYLKTLRVTFAIAIFVPILLFFVDFADVLPDNLHKLLQIQIVPAIFAGAVLTLVILFLLTLIFGRIYCSVICPAGILQDIFNRLSCIGKKKKNGSMRFKYHKPMNILRYALLAIIAALAVFKITEPVLALDPYSNFGRIATNMFRPAIVWINNILADILSASGNYSLYNVTMSISTGALIAAIIAFVVFAVMVYFRGRLFCNSICPVGALLSIISRYSFFKISFDKNKCISCRACERTCKAEAIDTANMAVDASRCVTCFNCTSACTKDALRYKFAPLSLQKQNTAEVNKQEYRDSGSQVSASRRSFITSSATLAGSIPLLAMAQGGCSSSCADCDDDECANNRHRNRHGQCSGESENSDGMPITPPGSLSIERFKDLCTGCHICVVQCPTHVLKPAGLEYGFSYMLKPHMSYYDSYCNFGCNVCSEVCPTDAIKPISVEEKKTTQIGVAHFHIERCVVNTDENDCGACSEHCPTQAVHMVPYKGTLTIPKVDPELCVGCGGCESICPVRPKRAITIVANTTHKKVEQIKEEKAKDVEVDDFGF